MIENQCAEVLVVLNVAPDLEDTIVDWLLSQQPGIGFTGFPVFGHSTDHAHLNPREQVSGRAKRQQFQVQLKQSDLEDFLQAADKTLGAVDARYWVLPIFAFGHLGGIRQS